MRKKLNQTSVKNKRSPSKEFIHIGNILNKTLKKFRRKYDEGMSRVWDVWEQVVGNVIAQNAYPAAFKGKILIVHVSSSSYIHHLQFLKDGIIGQINTALGENVVEEIKFKIGPVREWED